MTNNILLSLFRAVLLLMFLATGCTGQVKEPAVAGTFYPADREALQKAVDSFIKNAEDRPVQGRLIALIAPHAGYQYSGAVAGHTYRHLKEREIDTVILIGASHHKSFLGASVYTTGSMKTPLGLVRINEKISRSLINENAGITFQPDAFDKEHSLEVQLPFLQQALKNFTIVPVLIGTPTRESFDFLIEKLVRVLNDNPKAIIIASSDLSHFHDYETAVKMDKNVASIIEKMSAPELESCISSGTGEMCGGYPVIMTMIVAQQRGATNGVLYKYANSGDVTPDKNRVVGYAAIGLYRSGFTDAEKAKLLSLAKETVISFVSERKTPSPEFSESRLKAHGATFVTINMHGQLRGCIGNIQPTMPLYQSVINNAVSAATRDPRFPPMTKEELKDMEVEISVLSPLEPLPDVKKIEIGKHGLLLVHGLYSGLLLPQVASEFHWDVPTFLQQLSLKAGLDKDAWKNAKLYSFTAEIIK